MEMLKIEKTTRNQSTLGKLKNLSGLLSLELVEKPHVEKESEWHVGDKVKLHWTLKLVKL